MKQMQDANIKRLFWKYILADLNKEFFFFLITLIKMQYICFIFFVYVMLFMYVHFGDILLVVLFLLIIFKYVCFFWDFELWLIAVYIHYNIYGLELLFLNRVLFYYIYLVFCFWYFLFGTMFALCCVCFVLFCFKSHWN